MKISMDDSRFSSISGLLEFVKGSIKFEIKLEGIQDKYDLIKETIKKFKYQKLSRKDKHIVRLYLKKLTSYKKAQLNRLISKAIDKKLEHKIYERKNPHQVYTSADIKLLEQTDALHRRLNRFATKEILRREAEVFGKSKYQHIAGVSSSHIDNLRKSKIYRQF